MKPVDPFPGLMHSFFYERLVQQRNVSAHTVRSYRDTWRLFLRFVAAHEKRPVTQLALADLTAVKVTAFLHHAETERQISIGTRNCRLAALRSFFGFVAEQEPTAIAQCAQIRHIPMKKDIKRAPYYLESSGIEAILTQPDRSCLEGQRDHALLTFLYNTGARIKEALDVCPAAIRFDAPMCVRLFGKGRKERICPLWPETVALLKALLSRFPRADDSPMFANRYGAPLGASGVRFKLAIYVRAAAQTVPSLSSKKVSPHTFRHAAAVHLVAAGVDITVIRSWLGHADLNTTNHYAQANLATKRAAIERLETSSKIKKPPRWRRDESVLAWLDSLC